MAARVDIPLSPPCKGVGVRLFRLRRCMAQLMHRGLEVRVQGAHCGLQ